MSKAERNGKRKGREQSSKVRIPELGYYFIVTDTKETEKNYMNGLRDSIPKELQGKLVIKVIKTETKNLVNEALNMASINPQYGEPWIVFDRDQVENFDDIISEAEEKGIQNRQLLWYVMLWMSFLIGGKAVLPFLLFLFQEKKEKEKNRKERTKEKKKR